MPPHEPHRSPCTEASTSRLSEHSDQPSTMYGLRRKPRMGTQSLTMPNANLKLHGSATMVAAVA